MSINNIGTVSQDEQNAIENILNQCKKEKGNLITILQMVQEHYGYLSPNILSFISNKMQISLAEILSIATFYAQFKFNKIGKYYIVCCEGTACHVKGGPLLLNYVESKIGIKSGETTKDGLFSLESVACLGCCAISPVCVINDEIHGKLTLKKIKKILNNIIKKEKQGSKL